MNRHTAKSLDLPTSIVVLVNGQVAASCTVDRVFLAAAVEGLPSSHPRRDFAEAKCLVAGAILRGDVEGAYDDEEADEAARLLVASRMPRQ
ncbi:hypothetical protein AB0L40_03325 [Patulibacter sp. NPDC049589]|uniref:hypothetical protein n=1 Tax=Patulibacter sp. NPDC049589 TaxID=3154731 RepID=UPI00341A80B1